MSAAAPETPAAQPLSRVSVEATELNEDETGWTEAGIFIDRDGDAELAMLLASPAELQAIYDGLKLHFEQGIWSFRTVER